MSMSNDAEVSREKNLQDLVTAFGWRGRRGLSAEVGPHPNDFLLYAFFGSMKSVGVALRTALRGTTEPVVLIGDIERSGPVADVLGRAGFDARVINWHYDEPMPPLPDVGRLIICEIPLSYSDYSVLFDLHKNYSGLSTIWELTLPFSAILEVMLLLDYNVGIPDQINRVTESLEAHEVYFDKMCDVYSTTTSLLPCMPRVLDLLGLRGKTVIEFGPSDGLHTAFLVSAGARRVTVVEGRPENVVKLLAAKYAFGWDNLEIVTDNFQYPGAWAARRYDAVFSHGVFYHCLNPFYFMELMAQITDRIFLGGWVATEGKQLSEWQDVNYRGRTYRVQTYDEPSHFCSGLAARSTFLDAAGVEAFYKDRGFRVEFLERDPTVDGLTDTFLRWFIARD